MNTNGTTTTKAAAAAALFERLAAPFDPSEVKEREGRGGQRLRYINARTARRRLNDVLGPFGWECSVEPGPDWVRCTLTVYLPDGREITRQALGGFPDMDSEEDRVKGGDSDAFKRACALFGIGEYLYDDAPVVRLDPPPARPARPAAADPRRFPNDTRFQYSRSQRSRSGLFGFLKDNGILAEAVELGQALGFGRRVTDWSNEEGEEVVRRLEASCGPDDDMLEYGQ